MAVTPPHAPQTPPSPLARAERFVWLTARVLEQRLFSHHFRQPDRDAVQTALDAYANPDGGYGWALEPDLRGPVSQPLHTAAALRILDGIGRCAGHRVERVCRYLTSVTTPEGALPALHPSLRGYPAAPWMPLLDDPPGDLLATGPVVGLLHRNDVWHAWLFRATEFCWTTVEALERTHPYEVHAALAFLDSAPDRSRAEAAAARLGRLVREQRLAVTEPGSEREFPLCEGYGPDEHHYVTDFVRTPDSLARRWFTDEETGRCLDHLASRQQEDGGWPLTWQSWAPGTGLESRPAVTLEALRTLRAFGRPV